MPHLQQPPTTPGGGRDLLELRMLAGLSIDQAAEWSGLHRTTLRRMERGQARAAPAVARLWMILGGWMPWSGWEGWECVGGELRQAGSSRGWTAGDVMGLTWWHSYAAAVRARERDQVSGDGGACAVSSTPSRRARP